MAALNKEPNVLIAGGGPGGLLASILLDNIGVSSMVIERAKEPDQWSSKSYTIVLGDRGKSSLESGGCLESVQTAGNERKYVYFFDAKTGKQKAMPKKSPGVGLTRPLLEECLEKMARNCPRVTLKRGVGVSSASKNDDETGLQVHLEDGTVHACSHVIGADGKWSTIRESFPSLKSQAKIITSPSFGVAMISPTTPRGFKLDGTYVINPGKECMFYIIASPLPSGGFSISMVCYDETLEKYPWLAPPTNLKPGEYGKGGWEDEFSAVPQSKQSDNFKLSDNLQTLFMEEIPEFYDILPNETFKSVRVNRRTNWLQMSAPDDRDVTYSTGDGLVTLIGDAAHAMTPSMGEGCNCALESATRLVNSISAVMNQKGESTCSAAAISEGFIKYGSTRPKECIPIQEASAARNILRGGVKKSTPTPEDPFLHPKKN
mmetsp:Transcript_23907/g.57656  ORF Transcript_23907/g.57656 Transcript_23907/m.57656 type:complete len:432 (+) Transcript_23907:139-1434(+)|eukprot:CAMPEP_0181108288 /NCGR_PEP_ID=MMETSP1071-20121207/17549_1 /TAXON_ID=35127 /ORGANISM="Thalassiosira sp., Strain NH16" /LENGTH=431 /DNA_ID=CAMNT_0023191879 /DNA_START=70 /DNA_END=1365 /DNA_ORIENTATION=-